MTQRNCVTCHSVDYLSMQPPGKGKAFWEAEVTKMRQVYTARIDDADVPVIVAYLTVAY